MKPTPRNAWKLLHNIADGQIGPAERAFLRAIGETLDTLTLGNLEATLRFGEQAARAVVAGTNLAGLAILADRFARILRPLYTRSAIAAATQAQVSMHFRVINPEAVKYASKRGAELVTEVTQTTKRNIRRIVSRGFREGRTPQTMAREIRDVVGLTTRQAAAVTNYKAALEKKGVASEKVDARGSRYAAKLLRQRARMIARTETINASVAGEHALWDDLYERGVIGDDARRIWIVTPDDRLAIVGAATRILTIDGWKPVSRIRIGTQVLTHADRFCRVTAAIAKRYDGPTVQLNVGTKAVRKLHLTYGHPVLVEREGQSKWVSAEDVVRTDLVFVSAIPCAKCGGLRPSGPSYSSTVCHPCNIRIQNADPIMRAKQREAVLRFNAERWTRPGERERQAARWREANPVREGLKARGRKNYGKSFPELKIRNFLTAQGIEFKAQWLFRYGESSRRGFADFYLPGPRVVIECDGPTHQEAEVSERDKAKDAHWQSLGLTVLRFTDDIIRNEFVNVASQIRAHCCFIRMPLKDVTHRSVRHQVVYHLTVADDESYVAAGMVVHNCPSCAAVPGMNPDGVALDEPFSTPLGPVMRPTLHPNCRCDCGLVPYAGAVEAAA